jgi:aldehyde dehydrogenase (NAD+)
MPAAAKTTFDRFLINGEWLPASGGERIDVTDSATGEPMGHVIGAEPKDVAAAVEAAAAASENWAWTPVAERTELLRALGARLEDRFEELAELEAREIGTPITESREVQVLAAAELLQQIPAHAEQIDWEDATAGARAVREPVGVVGAITAWNFPLLIIAAKVGGALAAGCTIVVKSSEVAPLSSFVFAEEAHAVGFPPGVLNIITGYGATAGQALVKHPAVEKISFTGSVASAQKIALAAAPLIKPLALELGGKSASLVLDDADLEQAVRGTLENCFQGTGQVCDATTRLLVPRERLTEAEEIAAEVVEKEWLMGPPLEPEVRLGPLVSAAQRDRVDGYIALGIEEGAKLLTGGRGHPAGLERGYFIRPTVFSAENNMRIAREEIFGPVLTLVPYGEGDSGAVAVANDSPYGLGGAVWSADQERAIDVARHIRTGSVRINGAPLDPTAPFGGYGQSGFGRENGRWGIEEFLSWKALHL